MKFLERSLEDLIYKTDNCILRKMGLNIYGEKHTQVRLNNKNICDLITIDIDDSKEWIAVNIYELKKENVTNDSLNQVFRYCRVFEKYIQCLFPKLTLASLNAHLIGFKDKTNNIICPDFIDSVSTWEYSYNHDGISFINTGNAIPEYEFTHYKKCSLQNSIFNTLNTVK